MAKIVEPPAPLVLQMWAAAKVRHVLAIRATQTVVKKGKVGK